MDIRNPIGAIFPGAHGQVLAVLARTFEPLSGRRVAALTNGQVSASRAASVLSELSSAGIVLSENRPPAKLYRLNRDHVAAAAISELTGLWSAVLDNIRGELAGWTVSPLSACLFGSAARGEAGTASDIDILIVVADTARGSFDRTDPIWEAQLDRLADRVLAWSGNACEVLELTAAEVHDAATRDDRLVRDLRSDAVALAGVPIKDLLSRRKLAR